MAKSTVFRALTWAEFSITLKGPHTTVGNRRLDAIVRNRSLPAEDRFDAYLLRTSWGNHSEFACNLIPKSQRPETPEQGAQTLLRQPLQQTDFARVLHLSKQSISAAVNLRIRQGLLTVESGLLIPVSDPRTTVDPTPPLPEDEPVREFLAMSRNKKFLSDWRERNPDVAKQEEEHRAELDRITALKLEAFRAWKDSASARNPSPARHGQTVHDVMVKPTMTPKTDKTRNSPVSKDLSKNAGGQTLNLKEEEQSSSSSLSHSEGHDDDDLSAAQFNEHLCEKFSAIGANPPTKRQTNVAHTSLQADAALFLEWLSPNEMSRRRPQHGGILPLLVEEFQKFIAARRKATQRASRIRPDPTPEDIRASYEWMAENDPEPESREYARRWLAENGESKGASGND